MVPIKDLPAFAVVSLVLVAIPCQSIIFTISSALTYGKRTALLNVAGNTVGLGASLIATGHRS